MLHNFIGHPLVDSATRPANVFVTSDSISFDFQTDVPIVAGTEQYYKYLVQYRIRNNDKWEECLPLTDHPDGATTSRRVLSHAITNLVADTDYEVQVAVCRVWYGVRDECALAVNPVVSVRTGENKTLIP